MLLLWIKRNWKWILFPIGILLVLAALLGRSKARGVVVPPPADIGLRLASKDREVEAAVQEAEKHHDQVVAEIEKKHTETIQALSEEQRKTYEQLKAQDGEALTSWLLKVGKGDV